MVYYDYGQSWCSIFRLLNGYLEATCLKRPQDMPRLPASWHPRATPHRMLHPSALTIVVQISISIAYLAPCRFGLDSLEMCPHDWPLVHRYGPRWTQLNFELVIHSSDILHHTTAWVHSPQSQCDTTMITLPQHRWRQLSSTIHIMPCKLKLFHFRF